VRPVDTEGVRGVLRDLAGRLPARPHRVRLLVRPDGELATEAKPLRTGSAPSPLRVGLAKAPVDPRDPFLHHKTTHRASYRRALDSRPDCEDVLLWNGNGEVTESSRANVVARIGGGLVTPPASCGLLAGTFRAELLSRGTIRERVITLAELEESEELYLVNSVEQWMDAVLVD
jgi:para-aminobenzoate synthetase/4-amino-4-deoxychorismate lyase